MVSLAGALGSGLFGLLGIAGSKLIGGKKPAAAVQPLPMATRDDAKARVNLSDEMLRRKGGAADIITGVRGAEAPSPGGKLVLGA